MYKQTAIAFYNCENFYDTIHNPAINDVDFTPAGLKKYTSNIYRDKTEHLATVISQVATGVDSDGPAIIGVAEIENDTVLNDLLHHPLLAGRHYKFVHYDSKDPRGVDVALIYDPRYFIVENSEAIFVWLPGSKNHPFYTRDILWVKGRLNGETIHIYVNHWPSRSGGEERSAPARVAAAAACRAHMDKILSEDPGAKIIVMGDLNDNPVNKSVEYTLKARGKVKDMLPGDLFNPWVALYKRGIGTIAFGDAWGLFDQVMVSGAFLNTAQQGWHYSGSYIFNEEFVTENRGRYKGYPMRTWDGNSYRGGYSDHFPVYIVLAKK